MLIAGGVVAWNPTIFLIRYPEFSSVDPGKLASYWDEAGIYLSNTPRSPVRNLTRRQILLNMLVAHISYLMGDLEATGIQATPPSTTLNVAAPTAGTFAVPHGLGVRPKTFDILMTSTGNMWQSAPSDSMNIYLGASFPGITADISVFQTSQVASAGGSVRPVGRMNSASEGSVSASFDYGNDTSGEWFNQSPYGAAFWQATINLRSFRYFPARTYIR